MKLRFKITATAVIVLLVISLSLNIVSAVNQSAVPGSDKDPIVSKSYVDAAVKELSTKIQMLIELNDVLKSQNAQLTTELTKQEKTIKTLQDEINAIKSGTTPVKTDPSTGTGSGGTAKPEDTKPPATLGKAVVNTAVLNLRSQPNTKSTILGKLLKNETVTLISKESNGWYKITTSSGKTGYVLGTLITLK
ncbi:MAG: SH3 domain-containing protein [Clostridiaceae bacterium]|nr:SH3 domain-containing protein [Clostridiaceae bacterium]